MDYTKLDLDIRNLIGAYWPEYETPRLLFGGMQVNGEWRKDEYNDYSFCLDSENGMVYASRGTTQTGVLWMDKKRRLRKGWPPFPGLMIDGPHIGVWRSGWHLGKPAMVSGKGTKPFRIARDKNLNHTIDDYEYSEAGHGVYMHTAKTKEKIRFSSALCQVPISDEFLIKCVELQKKSDTLADYVLISRPKIPDFLFDTIVELAGN